MVTTGSDSLDMRVWVTSPEKLPRSVKVIVECDVNLEWVVGGRKLSTS